LERPVVRVVIGREVKHPLVAPAVAFDEVGLDVVFGTVVAVLVVLTRQRQLLG